jgi:basic amino acid/polyamine antiporter, APA family
LNTVLSPSAVREPQLDRAIGVRQLAMAVINTTVGAGIFVIPAFVSRDLGAAAPLAFIVCGAIMGLIVTTIAVAGSRVSLTGGIYAYVEIAFGPYVGFLAGVLQWLSGLLAVSSVATAMIEQIGTIAPQLGTGPVRMLTLAAMFGALAALNARGVRSGTRLIETMTVVKMLPLLIFVGVGMFFVDSRALAWPGLPAADVVGRSALLLIFAFSGVEVAIAPSGEIRNPAYAVPRAVFTALAITTALYIAIQLVAQGVLGNELSQREAAPLADATARFLGAAGRAAMLAAAVCSMFGYLSGDMLSNPRNVYALARDGFLPGVLARIDPRWRTPRNAIWTHAALATLFASASTFQSLAVIANVALLILYLLCCGAAMELTRRNVREDGQPFAWPGTGVAPILGALLMLWILSTATARELGFTGLVLVIATAAYIARRSSMPSTIQ